jgi:anti-anti-sigma factor
VAVYFGQPSPRSGAHDPLGGGSLDLDPRGGSRPWLWTTTPPGRKKGFPRGAFVSQVAKLFPARSLLDTNVVLDLLLERNLWGEMMIISSRTPEGQPNHCPVCGADLKIEPSDPAGDAPCPQCGHLLWFTWEDLGDVQVIKPTGKVLQAESFGSLLDTVSVRPGMRLVLDFSDVQYLSSNALGKLINLKKKLGAARGRLQFRGLSTDLREVFRITRLDQVFEVEP